MGKEKGIEIKLRGWHGSIPGESLGAERIELPLLTSPQQEARELVDRLYLSPTPLVLRLAMCAAIMSMQSFFQFEDNRSLRSSRSKWVNAQSYFPEFFF